MTLHGLMGLLYITDIAVAVLAATMMLLMKKEKIISFDEENRSLTGTLLCLVILSILYFLIDYYSVIIDAYYCKAPVRVFDIWVAVTMQYMWFNVIRHICLKEMESRLWIVIRTGYIVILAESLINYGFIMNENYYVAPGNLRTVSLILQTGQSAFLMTMNIICIVLMAMRLKNKPQGLVIYKFGIIGTVFIMADGLQNTVDGAGLIIGKFILYNYGPDTFNLTALLQLGFGVCMLWYVVDRCFLAQYRNRLSDVTVGDAVSTEEERLAAIASEAELTERETEIMKLIYYGATYQDTAEALFISKNTVKHHITSMYEKIEVSSKMELINMIRERA